MKPLVLHEGVMARSGSAGPQMVDHGLSAPASRAQPTHRLESTEVGRSNCGFVSALKVHAGCGPGRLGTARFGALFAPGLAETGVPASAEQRQAKFRGR